MKRIVFVNLHNNAFLLKTLNKFLFKRSAAVKHRYLLDYLISNPEYEVCNYINDYGFSLVQKSGRIAILFGRILSFFENRYILRKNGIKQNAVKIIRKTDILPDDLIISYLNESHTLQQINDVAAFKAASALHYLAESSSSSLAKNVGIDVVFDESDLHKHSRAFQVRFDWYHKPVIVHPFVFASRFQRTVPFSARENRAFSTGTIIDVNRSEFTDIYVDPCNQPARRQIYDNQEDLKSLIACYNNYFLEDDNLKQVKPTDNKLVKIWKVYYNNSHTGRQKKYFSFDMVERFNHFKMFIVGEEIIGIPGIGFVEGMACGSAFIGQTIGYYEDYGMKEGVHYIGYDGSLDDLKSKISYYQQPEHQEELQQIANAGYEFAQVHFRGDAVAKELLDKLIEAQKKWMESNYVSHFAQ